MFNTLANIVKKKKTQTSLPFLEPIDHEIIPNKDFNKIYFADEIAFKDEGGGISR